MILDSSSLSCHVRKTFVLKFRIQQRIKICLLYTGVRHGKDLTTFKAEGNMNLSSRWSLETSRYMAM